jgi:predicted RNase H-related nuclease YkuK (DUF458 family)
MDVRKRFKKFGGEFIPDIIEYIKEYVSKDPAVTISLGCDSIQRRRKTVYAITLMMYNTDIKNGAHVVFFRENVTKIRDNEGRLRKEAEYVQSIGDFLQRELDGHYVRKDLSLLERRKYKFHVAKCNGQYSHVSYNEDTVVENMTLTDHEKVEEFKLIDLHLDFNPVEERRVKKANGVEGESVAKNKSNLSYKIYVPMLRGMGYRVFAKPNSHAATSAADLLLKD